MPDFVTPGIMMTKLNDLCRSVDKNGVPIVPGKRGRKPKKLAFKAEESTTTTMNEKPITEADKVNNETSVNKDISSPSAQVKASPKDNKQQPSSRSIVKKTKEFMTDLASMMERIFEEEEDGNLQQSDKATCQKLLLTVSVKEKTFSEEQRSLAKVLLRRLEGDRKRRCRTTGDFGDTKRRYRKKERKENKADVPEPRRKKRGRKPKNYVEEEDQSEKKSSNNQEEFEDDASIGNSDSEDDWSDGVEDDFKASKSKRRISRKEARRRRAWACDKDTAAAAGRTWPVIPKNVVPKVLSTMLEEVIKNDEAKGGLFSVPVPPDVFPEYYELVHDPMDYGTMKAKFARGEYRSAQAMQKDFILVMQNCLQFNSADSDIVKEARRQALSMPGILRNAAMKHNLFISEDGNVYEIHSDDEKETEKNDKDGDVKVPKKRGRPKMKKERKKRGTGEGSATKPRRGASRSKPKVRCNECVGCKREDCGTCLACMDKPEFGGNGSLKQGCYARQCVNPQPAPDSDINEDNSVGPTTAKKPRIRISLAMNGSNPADNREDESHADNNTSATKVRKRTSKKRPRINPDNEANDTKQENNADRKGYELGNVGPSIPKKKKNSDQDTTEQSESIKKNLLNMQANTNDDTVRLSSIPETADVKHDSEKVTLPSGSTMQIIPKKELNRGAENDNDGDMSDESGLIDESDVINATSPDKDDIPDDESLDPYMDLDRIKEERLELENSFDVCRIFFTKDGPWTLPSSVGEEKVYDVLRHILNKMCRYDTYKLFAERVTDKEAPDYSDVVSNPMDFATMRTKINGMAYGNGDEALSSFYHDFLLIMDNCALYNEKDSDLGIEAGRLMSLLPETFAASCLAVGDKKRKKKKI